MEIIVFILILSLLVIVHEFGHFWIARKNGVKVQEFGLGYPPKIKKLFTWKETVFTLNAIPFGGFVKLEGEEYNPEDEKTVKNAFYNKPAKNRLAVILAGPIANLIYGVIAFSIVFSAIGIPTSLGDRPRIEEAVPNSPAAEAGISKNMEIIAFRLQDDTIPVKTIQEVIEFIDLNRGETVGVVFQGPCDGLVCPENAIESEVYLRKKDETPPGEGSMGVAFTDFFFEKGPWYLRPIKGAWYGLKEAVALTGLIAVALVDLFGKLFGGVVPTEVTGPIGIVHQASQNELFKQGWATTMSFSGMLSINLAIMNILPIPALDGGRALFILLEKIIGKKRIRKFEGYANYGGFILLLGLIILISIRDVGRIFN